VVEAALGEAVMKPRTTLVLLGVFLALLAYVYFGEVRRPPASEPGTPTPPPIWEVPQDEVLGLTVRSGEQETRLARPAGGEWVLEAPQAEAADDARVTQVLSNLVDVTPSRTFTETVGPLEEYGLAEPSLEVTLRLADGRTQVLRIGASNPQQTAYYAQVEGQQALHLVPSWLVTSLQELVDQPPVRPTPTPEPTVTPVETVTPTPAG
jgi:hypothetical protein